MKTIKISSNNPQVHSSEDDVKRCPGGDQARGLQGKGADDGRGLYSVPKEDSWRHVTKTRATAPAHMSNPVN